MLNIFHSILLEIPLLAPEEETSRFMTEFFKMLFVLGGMVIVLFAISWYVKRYTAQRIEKANDTNVIKVIEQRTLSARSVIYLLDVEGKSYLVGETPHGLVKLSD